MEAEGSILLSRLFRGGGSGGPLHMEHFTAAQAAGKSNVGFGLEDPNTAVKQAHPAHDFERFVSTHLGFEPEEDVGTQVSIDVLRAPFLHAM